MRQVRVVRALIAVGVALGIAACASTSTGPNAGDALANAQRQLASSLAISIGVQVRGLTAPGAGVFIRFFTGSFLFPDNCGQLTPVPALDGDQDGIPDQQTETFTAPSCVDSSSGNLSFSGVFDISDPTPSTADVNYDEQITNFVLTDSGQSGGQALAIKVAVDGTLSVTASPDSISQSANYSMVVAEAAPEVVADSTVASLTTAYANDTQLSSVTGTESVTIKNTTYAFTVATPTPLTSSSSCPSRVVAGAVVLTFSSGPPVTITWSGCGAYTLS